MRSSPAKTSAPPRRDEIACAAAIMLAVIGVALSVGWVGWTTWTTVIAAIFTAAAVSTLGALVWRRDLVHRPPAIPIALFVGIAIAAAGTGVTTWYKAEPTIGTLDRERHAITQRASEIVELLTTVTPQTRDENLAQLRPLVVNGMAELIKGEVLDPIPDGATQEGTVRAVGIQYLIDGAAQVITVVEQTPPPPATHMGSDDDHSPSDLILALTMIREDGQWKLKTVAPATP